MNSTEKIQAKIKDIEKERDSKALLYATGGLSNFGTKIASDSLLIIKTLLPELTQGKRVKKITLLLRTLGGHTNAPWPIINLIREYGEEFEVIILDKALSAGTQICLGAEKIVMTSTSFLGPIDPHTVEIDDDGRIVKQIEVEDIINYFDFGKKNLRISRAGRVEMVKELNKEISPTKLGSIYRTHNLIEDISKKSLALHTKKISHFRIKKIVKKLTSKLYSHNHLINRREAKYDVGFGDIIEYMTHDLEKLSEELISLIHEEVHFDRLDQSSFQPNQLQQSKTINLNSGMLFSADKGFFYKHELELIDQPQGRLPEIQCNSRGWKEV